MVQQDGEECDDGAGPKQDKAGRGAGRAGGGGFSTGLIKGASGAHPSSVTICT